MITAAIILAKAAVIHEGMNKLKENKLRVFSILSENLKNPQPQVVEIEKIAGELQLSIGETRQLLLRMDEAGEIKSDVEG